MKQSYKFLAIFVVLIALSISSHLDTRVRLAKLQEHVLFLSESKLKNDELYLSINRMQLEMIKTLSNRIDSLENPITQ